MKRFIAFVQAAVKAFLDARCSLHAAGLTYYSLLAFIPVLCLLLTLAKAVGADDHARGFINSRMDTLIATVENGGDMPAFLSVPGQSEEKMAERRRSAGDFAHQARSAANTLFDRVARFDVRTLGWIGLLGLLWTAVSTLGTIEDSMNGIWHIEKPRSLVRQVWLYALVSVVLPLLVAVALSMPVMRGVKTVLDATIGATAYTRWAGDALTALFSSRLFGFVLSYLFSTLAFAFVLGFMPNTRVNRLAALEGGALTALFMGLWFKICAIAQVGISQAGMFYGSFAVFPIVLTWLYVSWRILLFGSILTHAFHRIHTDRSGALGPR